MTLSGESCYWLSSWCNNIGAHHRDKVGTSVAGNNLTPAGDVSDGEHQPDASRHSAFSSFATLGMGDGPEQVDAEEDFGGLMVCFHIDLLALSKN
jgi:hypothetical protein